MEMEDVSQAYMDFTITEEVYGATNTIELVPGGNDMDVDNSNVREYVQALVKYHMLDSIKDQLSEFLQGKTFVVVVVCIALASCIFSLCSLSLLSLCSLSALSLLSPCIIHFAFFLFATTINAACISETDISFFLLLLLLPLQVFMMSFHNLCYPFLIIVRLN